MPSRPKPRTKPKPKPPRDDSFKEFVADQLSGIDGVAFRAMFGGYGIYRRGAFFGIVYRNRLYFKTDDRTAVKYVERGMDCFQPGAGKRMRHFHEVPGDVIEDAPELCAWALEAVAVAGR